tara:strand:- start:305 stop:874 length:570 start_codon:yes stop_codon:yes gene_type:complete
MSTLKVNTIQEVDGSAFPFGSLIPITSTTITSEVSSVNIDDAFTAHRKYCLIIDKVSCTVNSRDFQMFCRDSGGNMTSGYRVMTSGDGSNGTFNENFMRLNYNAIGNSTDGSVNQQDFHAVFYISGFEVNRRFRIHGTSSYQGSDETVRGNIIAGCCTRTEAVVGMNFHWQSGNFRAGGKFSLFGVSGS